ncbi:hypothetical protein [Tenacibaculum dicentrarchi]|uniref:hypothetical protein n=1 Tax=Tenacibaculum dicentrarchi TaxID=669041 RepID=UPI003517430B
MKITEITKETIFHVHTEDGDYYLYTRYLANHWTVRMAESDERLYDCAEIEGKFQEYLSVNGG